MWYAPFFGDFQGLWEGWKPVLNSTVDSFDPYVRFATPLEGASPSPRIQTEIKIGEVDFPVEREIAAA
jgi:hypothetical protein